MTALPNPFCSAVTHPATVDAAAAPSSPVFTAGAAANQSSMETGGTQEATLAGPPNTRPASGLLDFDGPDIPLAELVRRGFDADGFVNDCEPLPAFLSAPRRRFLSATDIMPVLMTLAGARA